MTDAPYAAPFDASPRRLAALAQDWWATIDRAAVACVIGLLLMGVALSFGSSPAAVERLGGSEPLAFVVRQAVFAAAAGGVLLACTLLDPKSVRRAAFVLFGLMLGLMVVILFVGHEAKGAQRWLRVAGFSFQPVEVLKPAFVVLTAYLFAEKARNPAFPGARAAFALWVPCVILLLLQPDVGQTFLLTLAALTVATVAGLPVIWIAGLAALGVLGLVGLYFTLPHVAARLDGFLNGADGPAEQVARGLAAIASGDVFGAGPGEGVLKYHLPDAHTDFIFAVASEEFGLIAGLGLIVVFAAVVLRGLAAAARMTDPFRQFAGAGLFALFGFQAAINLAVNLDLVPPKGMTLPFISYGGSSLLGAAVTLGFALALTRRRA